MTTATIEYVGETLTVDVELEGHDPQHHANQVLTAFLTKTAADAELEGDEDDAEDWTVEVTDITDDGTVTAVAKPYRGEEAIFTFVPEEM